MKWEFKEIEVGDMVRVKMSEVYHYGVCTGENRIIEFGEPVLAAPKPKEEIKVIAVDIETFLNGDFAEVAVLDRKERKKRRKTKEIVAYAESCLGNGGYDILLNNCEHFATTCLFGNAKSSTIDDARAEIEAKIPRINVYIGKVENFCETKEIPSYTKKLIKKISNENVIKEKKAVYGLLSFGLSKMDISGKAKKCFLSETGKPLNKEFCFSASHSNGLVAVGISKTNIGIDLEIRNEMSESCRFEELMANEDESGWDNLKLWTVKEAIFKFLGKDKTFIPKEIDSKMVKTRTIEFSWEGESFVLSVAGDILVNLHCFKEPIHEEIR